MKCPKCKSENREGIIFCEECGVKLEVECPSCNKKLPLGTKFCGECGHQLIKKKSIRKQSPPLESERKNVTVLFSDMSGYTAITERLDPEEVKDLMSRIFGEIAQVITKYEGFIERFIGDAVMAIFGVPKAHEDDPIRAIKAAWEIHILVEALSPQIEEKIGQQLTMHSGINTGLVVTGEVDVQKGTHGITGDPINLASRLESLANKGEILVGDQTFRQAEGYFIFERLE
ncbi:MAG: zinc ribbon domain-containing protein, partial [Deltaproteobacteria bacterium]|nr:zinc ribbon domain-containing protein [Deltaproteobacteria bacterium]